MKKATSIYLALVLFLFFGWNAYSQNSSSRSEKVNIDQLEKKYWKTKDQKYTVVSDRVFSKAERLSISAGAGPSLIDTYSDGMVFGLQATYFMSERVGFEFVYSISDLSDNDLVGDLVEKGGAPSHGKVDSYYGVVARVVPFYSKMSFFGKKIIYFDMSFGLHLGMTTYAPQTQNDILDTEKAISYGIDVSQSYFLNKNFAIRADMLWRWHNQDIYNYGGLTNGTTVEGESLNKTRSVISNVFTLGVQYYF